MAAYLVFDGATFTLPHGVGEPRSDQLQGKPRDQLIEFAGRVCYDSLGQGRSSEAYHEHIREVNHGSVLEHAVFSFRLPVSDMDWDPTRIALLMALNRPGVHVRTEDRSAIILTANVRALLEWDRWSSRDTYLLKSNCAPSSVSLGRALCAAARPLASLAIPVQAVEEGCEKAQQICSVELMSSDEVLAGGDLEETWASVYLTGVSRGLTHELVRHKYRTAFSQRSTRYCDEAESLWSIHPVMWGEDLKPYLRHIEQSRNLYRDYVKRIEKRLRDEGKDALTARKQARGAARGILGNALTTDIVMSASLAQWKRVFAQRISSHADAEIHEAMLLVRKILTSRWPNVDFS